MHSSLIVMLTHHDRTVKNAYEIFQTSKDLPVECWGFKDVGLSAEGMKSLVGEMKAAGKKTFLEVVTYTERECLSGAELALECGFDYLMGTLFYDSVWGRLKGKPVKYLPFIGRIHGSPSILNGSARSIIDEGKRLVSMGIEGFDLLAFRYVGDAESLASDVVNGLGVPIVLAGSIDSAQRISKVNEISPWAFTIGSALFDGKFSPGGSFRNNLESVVALTRAL